MPDQSEELIWEGSQSQILNMGTFAAMGIVIAIITVISLLVFPLLLVLIAIPLFYMLWKWIKIRSSRYRITTQRVLFTQGIFSKKTDALELYRVRDVDMYEPFWQRMFKLGNLELITSDKTTPKFLLHAVPKPKELLDKIRTNVELRRDVKRVRGVEFMDDESLENT